MLRTRFFPITARPIRPISQGEVLIFLGLFLVPGWGTGELGEETLGEALLVLSRKTTIEEAVNSFSQELLPGGLLLAGHYREEEGIVCLGGLLVTWSVPDHQGGPGDIPISLFEIFIFEYKNKFIPSFFFKIFLTIA